MAILFYDVVSATLASTCVFLKQDRVMVPGMDPFEDTGCRSPAAWPGVSITAADQTLLVLREAGHGSPPPND